MGRVVTVVYGPPGTGKTHTLTEIIAGKLARDPNERILFTSHTRAAAQTALERVGVNAQVDTSTLHSFCFRELKMSRAQTVDDAKIEELLESFGLDSEDGGDGRRYQEVMSHAACTGKPVMETYDLLGAPGTRTHFEAFEKSYRGWKANGGYLDFSDMLSKYLLVKRPSGHRMLIIDEAQDMTPLHWKVVQHFMTLNPHCNVVVAGDDDQCLYAYAGADPHAMAEFEQRHNAKRLILARSYRVPRLHHSIAQGIAARMEKRVEKLYTPTEREGYYVDYGQFQVDYLSTHLDTLVLYNDKFIRQDVEQDLLDAGIPYTTTGGFPSPLQTRGAKAVYACHDPRPEVDTIRKGLSERGVALFNAIGLHAVVDKILGGDLSYVNFGKVEDFAGDYYQRVDWKVRPHIRLSTIHGAKGMEAEQVHLILAQSGAAIDHSFRDSDAQHRLFYVAVTRSKNHLATYEGDNSYVLPRP